MTIHKSNKLNQWHILSVWFYWFRRQTTSMLVITFIVMQQTFVSCIKTAFLRRCPSLPHLQMSLQTFLHYIRKEHTCRRREHCSVRQMSPGNGKKTCNPSLSNTVLFQKSFLSHQKIFCKVRTERIALMVINSSVLHPKEKKFLSPPKIHNLH